MGRAIEGIDQPGGRQSFQALENLRMADKDLRRERADRPGLPLERDDFEQDDDVLWFEYHLRRVRSSRTANIIPRRVHICVRSSNGQRGSGSQASFQLWGKVAQGADITTMPPTIAQVVSRSPRPCTVSHRASS